MTDIEQLEKDLKWLERQKQDGHCGEGTFERHQRYDHNERIDRLIATVRAHMETMRQEPFGFLHYEVADNEKGIKLHYEFSRHALTKSDKEAGWDEIKVYTTPPPAEQPVLKVPEIKYETLTGFDRGADAMRDKIIAMNPHLKVEES